MLLWQILGTSLGLTGIGALYLSWRRKSRSWALVGSGWSLLLGSVLSWSQTSGIDKGPALGIIAVVFTALAAVALTAWRTPVKQRRKVAARPAALNAQASVWHEGLTMAASLTAIAVVGLIASVAFCTALFLANRSLGLEHTANLTLTMFAFPVTWGGLATLVGYSKSVVTRAAVLLGMIAVSALIIFANF